MMVNFKKYLSYNPETGEFISIKNRGKRIKAGDKAGFVCSHGYIGIKIHGKLYYGHRLAWFFHYGHFPHEIDHINGNRSDNRIENLRNCDRQKNMRNRKINKNNTSGVMGVLWQSDINRWIARIGGEYLGSYINWFDAVCARKAAEHNHKYHFLHGRKDNETFGSCFNRHLRNNS